LVVEYPWLPKATPSARWRMAFAPGWHGNPSRTGYGTRAIRNLVPYEFGGAVELFFYARTWAAE